MPHRFAHAQRSAAPLGRGLALSLAGLSLVGCTMGERGSRRPRPYDPTANGGAVAAFRPQDAPPPERKPDPDRIDGTPPVVVTWEALAGEREKFADPHTKRASSIGQAGLPVILVNSSLDFLADENRELRLQRSKGGVAKISDREMNLFLAEIEQTGFYKYAKPTVSVQPYFASDRMRGRITIERDGKSLTLVSQYGLGLDPATREIPAIYARVKSSIFMLKNSTPTVGVSGQIVDHVDPARVKKGEPPTKPLK